MGKSDGIGHQAKRRSQDEIEQACAFEPERPNKKGGIFGRKEPAGSGTYRKDGDSSQQEQDNGKDQLFHLSTVSSFSGDISGSIR